MKIKQQLELYQTCKTKRPQSNLKEERKKRKKENLRFRFYLVTFDNLGRHPL